MTSTARITLTLVLLATTAGPATAQGNSLLGGGQRTGQPRQVPTTQPATHPTALTGTVMAARVISQEQRPEPKPNSTLLNVSPFAVHMPDPEVIGVNDLITIIIRESKKATSDSKMESKKDWKFEAELKKWVRLSDDHGIVPAIFSAGNPAAEFELKNDYGGDGKYDRKDELTTRVTARVIDVKPNGNIVLESTKSIMIDEEGYVITLVGECRGRDVTPENTVLSTQIAEPEISVQHSGALRDATRRGWLMRTFDFLRPF